MSNGRNSYDQESSDRGLFSHVTGYPVAPPYPPPPGSYAYPPQGGGWYYPPQTAYPPQGGGYYPPPHARGGYPPSGYQPSYHAPHGGYPSTSSSSSGVAAFEMKYANWLEEHHRHDEELKNAYNSNVSELLLVVQTVKNHYGELFRMKAEATKIDALYIISGVWRTPVERLFLWIGGSRPSQILNIVMPQLEPLCEEQIDIINKLRQSSQQCEDFVSKGFEKLQQSLAQDMALEPFSATNQGIQIAIGRGKLEALEGFVNMEVLIQLSRILSPYQTARGLVTLGEYLYRLRTLGSVWTSPGA